ncbi:MAG TPA: hypothetical protein VFB02_15500, partial [Bradyrhizobium sp.]|nr:hypothetical protein [Bradyrhizobium sp.]
SWNTFFAKSKPIVVIFIMDGSLCLVDSTPPVWHIDAVRGPSTPSLRAKRSDPGFSRWPWIASSLRSSQ